MGSRSLAMYEIKIPLDAINRLSKEDRYSYYVLGHMFNELMTLQKLIGFSMPKHDDRRPARFRPEWSQVLFLLRMSSSKLWEAMLTLRQKEVSATLREKIAPSMEDGAGRWKALNGAINSAPWLADLRNGLGFHFPSFRQWEPVTTPGEDWTDDVVFLGVTSGNTFYDGADNMAQHWMFRQYGHVDVRNAVEPLIDQMIDLLRLMNRFLEDALGAFVSEFLLSEEARRKCVGKVIAPEHRAVSIPFWTSHRERGD